MEVIDIANFLDMNTIIFIGVFIALGFLAWYIVDVYLS